MASNDKTDLINELRSARRAAKLSQEDLARRIGRSQAQVSKVETSAGDPRLSTLLSMARALGLELLAVPKTRVAEIREILKIAGPGKDLRETTVLEDLYVPDPEEDDDEDGPNKS